MKEKLWFHAPFIFIGLVYLAFMITTSVIPYQFDVSYFDMDGFMIGRNSPGHIIPGTGYSFGNTNDFMNETCSTWTTTNNIYRIQYIFSGHSCQELESHDQNISYIYKLLMTEMIVLFLLTIIFLFIMHEYHYLIKLIICISLLFFLLSICHDVSATRYPDTLTRFTHKPTYNITGKVYVNDQFLDNFHDQYSFEKNICNAHHLSGSHVFALAKFDSCNKNPNDDSLMVGSIIFKTLASLILFISYIALFIIEKYYQKNIFTKESLDYQV